MSTTSGTPVNIPNPLRRIAVIWWVLCAILLAGIFTPFLLDFFHADVGDWVFAVMFFCLVFGITTIIIAVIYTKRARLVSRMLIKENLLAYWTYPPAEWSSYAQKEHEENKREKRNLFLVVVAVSFIIGIILSIMHLDGWLIFLSTVLGIIVLMGGSAALAVWMRYRQNRKYQGEVYISPIAVYLNRELHVWQGYGASLEEVSYHDTGQTTPLLKIVYSSPSRSTRLTTTVRVPVPTGEEENAKRIASILQPEK
jgi:hypothetical protein